MRDVKQSTFAFEENFRRKFPLAQGARLTKAGRADIMVGMSNVILIGMPSAGKSTVGNRLSQLLGYGFIDCDAVIENEEGAPLSVLIERDGAEGFLEIEARVCRGIAAQHCVIATGGSACYLPQAMTHFRSLGKIVYLRIEAEEVERRIPDFTARGVVMRGNVRTVRELYAQRAPLYEEYADLTVLCEGKSTDKICREIAWRLGRRR